MSRSLPVRRIVSGGQTGVDRAALDVAIELQIAHDGWCPRGRLAEDGTIPLRFRLQETDSATPAVRTRRNVRDSDGTLIISSLPLTDGTALTERCAHELDRPVLVVGPDDELAPMRIRRWLIEHSIETLNVAGPRASQSPGIQNAAAALLRRAFTE